MVESSFFRSAGRMPEDAHGNTLFNADASRLMRKADADALKPDNLDSMSVQRGVTDVGGSESQAGPASEARSAVRTLPDYVMAQVGRQIMRGAERGDRELLLKLKPAHLGRLQMSIDNSSDGLKVSIIAEHETSKDMLMSHSNELRKALMEQGIRLEKIDVQTAPDFDQFTADTRQGAGGFREESRRSLSVPSGRAQGAVDGSPEISPARSWRGDGSLNLVA